MIIQRKEKHDSYDKYVYLQGFKYRNRIDKIKATNRQRTRGFEEVFKFAQPHLLPGKVLCLGARTGCEVRAARNLGYTDSIGIDLYPAPEKDEVIQGDWHNIPFNDSSFENVFTNALDHCYDPDRMIKEVHRVLKPAGRFFFRTMVKENLKGKKDKEKILQEKFQGSMDYLFWDTAKDLVVYFEPFGFYCRTLWRNKRWESFVLMKSE